MKSRDSDPSGLLPVLEPDDEPLGGTVPPPPPSGAPEPEDLADSLSRAAADPDSISLVDLDGGDAGLSLGDPQVRDEAPATLEPAHEVAPPGPAAEDDLQLDLAAAGLSNAPRGMSAPGDDRAVAPAAAPGPAASVAQDPPAPVPPQSSPNPSAAPARFAGPAILAPEGYLGGDQTALGLAAAAIGLCLGLGVGVSRANKVERTIIDPLHAELTTAVERPLAARAGKIKTSAAVKAELEAAHAQARTSFLTGWLLTGLVVAGGLFFVGRRYA